MRRRALSILFLSLTLFLPSVGRGQIHKSVNPTSARIGDTVTWTLSAMAGPDSVGDLYDSGATWGGSWTDQVTGNNAWGVSGGALWYAPSACVSEGNYPQYINNGVMVGNAEFYYETLIPPIGCQPQEDSELIFRNVACNRYFMVRLDHYLGSDGCPVNSTSKLFYDKVTPLTAQGVCTPGVSSGIFEDAVASANVSCVVKNTWYSVRVRSCGATLRAKTWLAGTSEPMGWQLEAVDSALTTYTSGNFGFQANQGQTAFRNMTVSSIASQGVTVTDSVPSCLTSVAVVGAPSKGTFGLSGNNVTWNVGTMSPCESPATLTLSSVVGSCLVGSSVTNLATDGTKTAYASVSIRSSTPSIQITKSITASAPYTTGNISVQVQVCNIGTETADSVTVRDYVTTGWQNLSWCGPYSSYTQVVDGATVTIGRFMNWSVTAALMTVDNLPGGSCVPVTFCMTDLNVAAHSCVTILDHAEANYEGMTVTSAQLGVNYPCLVTTTWTPTPTPTPTDTFTMTPTKTSTPTGSPTPSGTLGYTLTKSLLSPASGIVTGNGPITFALQLCTSGSGTLGSGVSLSGSVTLAASEMITLVDNLTMNYANLWNHNGYGVPGNLYSNSSGWFNGVQVTFNALPGGFSGGSAGLTLQLTNLVGGTCVTLYDVYQENNYANHLSPCAAVTNWASIAGSAPVSALPVTVSYSCPLSGTPTPSFTTTSTPTHTWTVSVSLTPTRTTTPTPTFTLTRTPTMTITTTQTPTRTATLTATRTMTQTLTLTSTFTRTPTTTPSPTPTRTYTQTPIYTWTPTLSWTYTTTRTSTPTPTPSSVVSVVPGDSPTPDPWVWGGTRKTFVYPSPARGPWTHVAYRMKRSGRVHLRVWNAAAEKVAEVMEDKPSGPQTSVLTVRDYAPGVYIYRVILRYDSGMVEKLPIDRFVVAR